QIARQKAEPFAGFDSRAGEDQALDALALQRIDGTGDSQPGLAGARGADAEGDVVLENLVQIVALTRRARAQIAAPGAQAQAHVVDGRQVWKRLSGCSGFVALFCGKATRTEFDQ